MTDLLTLDGWGQQVSTFRFDLLDDSLAYIGNLDVAGTARVENNINRSIKRQMTDLTLLPSTLASVNLLTDRVRPVMVLGDGTEYPLGVFVFTDSSTARLQYASRQFVDETDSLVASTMLHDHLTLLDVAYDRPIAFKPGTLLVDAINELMERVATWSPGISWVLDESNYKLNVWFVRPPGTNLREAINNLCLMAGFYSMFVDNTGVFRAISVPPIDEDPDFIYGPDANVFSESIVESTDLLNTPNRYIVINSALTDTAIYGQWDVPAEAPHSIANRKRVITSVHDFQGLDNNNDANAAARANGLQDSSAYEWVDFDAAPNPLHDTFNLVQWLGNNYREQGWSLTLKPGGVHHHTLRRTYNPDAEEVAV